MTEETAPLLDRLIQIHDENEAAMAVAAARRLDQDVPSFEEIVSNVRLAAIASAENNNDTNALKRIHALNVIPDDRLADGHENEMNYSSFVYQFIPRSDWSRYIVV